MYPLSCSVQKYAWGRPGSDSKVAAYKASQDSSFVVDTSQRYAELWMGTHVNGPSQLLRTDASPVLLSEHLAQNESAAMGTEIAQFFYSAPDSPLHAGDLPFLFKVLCIDKALSIQAHPNKLLAAQLHARDPVNYADANHKPEMIIAISANFEAMCGFRPHSEIAKHLAVVPQLRNLCNDADNCVDKFISASLANDEVELQRCLKLCFTSLMNRDEILVKTELEQLRAHISIQGRTLTSTELLFLRLINEYPGDVGCFAVFLLNCFELAKGECVFLAANVPHAYLRGDGVECMACSDNVVRAGLTPKFKDVKVLCNMLDYRMASIQENKLRSVRTELSRHLDYLNEFRPPNIDEFSVQEVRVLRKHLMNAKVAGDILLPQCPSGSILIVIEGEPCGVLHVNPICQMVTQPGLVYFIDANTDVNFVNVSSIVGGGDDDVVLLAYRAYCDIKL